MKVINLSENNSVLNQFLREIRDVEIQKDSLRFRTNIERIGEVMAIELSKTLNYELTNVRTPLGTAPVNTVSDQLVLATILRAGLPLYQGFLRIFDKAENAFLSAYRRVVKDENAHYRRSDAGDRHVDGGELPRAAQARKTLPHPSLLHDRNAAGD